jgi:hypothetical protein
MYVDQLQLTTVLLPLSNFNPSFFSNALIPAEAFSFPKPIATVRTRFFRTTRNAGISPGAAATLKVNTDDVIRGNLILPILG